MVTGLLLGNAGCMAVKHLRELSAEKNPFEMQLLVSFLTKCIKMFFWAKKTFVYSANISVVSDIIGLHQPPDGVTNPKYKLQCFVTTNLFFFKEKKALAFNRDRCCHLAFCLQLILFHWRHEHSV